MTQTTDKSGSNETLRRERPSIPRFYATDKTSIYTIPRQDKAIRKPEIREFRRASGLPLHHSNANGAGVADTTNASRQDASRCQAREQRFGIRRRDRNQQAA